MTPVGTESRKPRFVLNSGFDDPDEAKSILPTKFFSLPKIATRRRRTLRISTSPTTQCDNDRASIN
ncbi:hypothetical protein AS156_20810 [Bradyrhizobium macuxiense]|uniref:Uncharacterized protein n=1 Tax=Bradyrhizobium macuxiense TaxID=1755647 RepID=A0A109JDE9_9BRAD|nr:hypothetical protein AS156_20810 [Bradyrhizobium macuxiense]